MSADAARDRTRPTRSTRGPVPMTGTGDGPRPDPTTLALATRSDDEGRTTTRTDDTRRLPTNRPGDHATTQ
ncbi:hypothetical protein [Halorubrum tebenquichense]|uniref:Uncharacterized protein n=1 Tax=Halorubrum tebenquichense DSM 14210 TaxID=1227485 RepID=M0E3W4_9EURY|nr:hypothetical protein [Halorubrum tebenquichense]ELZ41044.1 hypothetical protein C472_01217 [Halorubrum tebenquichense DSM 14210]